jgi:hypothetical protein
MEVPKGCLKEELEKLSLENRKNKIASRGKENHKDH